MTHTFLLGVILSIIPLGQTSNSSYQCKDTGCITHFANQDLEAECVYVSHANWTSIGEKYNLSTPKEDGLCAGECCRCLRRSPPSQPICNDVRGRCKEAFEGAGTCIDAKNGDLSNIDINVEPLEGICGTEHKNCCQCFKLKTEDYPDPKWKKIFSHDTTGGLFTNSDWKSKNTGNPSALLYSILDTMEDYRLSDGTFHLRLCYPLMKDGSSGCNEWTQTSNPVTKSSITGYKPINIDFKLEFKGLGVNIPKNQGPAMIDYKPDHSWWFYPIGAKSYWGGSNTIPGPYLKDWGKNSPVTKVVLSVVQPVVPVNTSTPTNITSSTTTTNTPPTTTKTCVVTNGPCEMCNKDADCQPGAGCFADPPLSDTRVCHCKLGYYLDNSTCFSCPHTGTCVDFRTSTCVSDAQAAPGPNVNELSRDGCLMDSREVDSSLWGICPYCRGYKYEADNGGYISLGTYVSGEGNPDTGDPMVFENGGPGDFNCVRNMSSIAYWYCWYDFYPSSTVPVDYLEIMWSENPLCHYLAYIYTPLACDFAGL